MGVMGAHRDDGDDAIAGGDDAGMDEDIYVPFVVVVVTVVVVVVVVVVHRHHPSRADPPGISTHVHGFGFWIFI